MGALKKRTEEKRTANSPAGAVHVHVRSLQLRPVRVDPSRELRERADVGSDGVGERADGRLVVVAGVEEDLGAGGGGGGGGGGEVFGEALERRYPRIVPTFREFSFFYF